MKGIVHRLHAINKKKHAVHDDMQAVTQIISDGNP